MTKEMVLAALKGVTDPDLGVDLVTLKFVKDKDITVDGGRVSVAIEMATPSPSKRERSPRGCVKWSARSPACRTCRSRPRSS